tara:strand:+ start:1614 stop:2012 length:399 start_codon:yes stop_codon:yes gene_type:complete
MAKQTEKVAYITLGEGAVSFYDPANGVQLIPGKVLKIDESRVNPKGRLGLALRGGHVDKTDEEAYNLYTNGEGVEVSKAIEEIEEDIISLSKPQLVSRAKDLGSNLTKNKLKGMTVSQLNDLITELESEEEN